MRRATGVATVEVPTHQAGDLQVQRVAVLGALVRVGEQTLRPASQPVGLGVSPRQPQIDGRL